MEIINKPIFRRLAASVIGGALGFAYYYFIGCRTGTCPITSNPWISTLYGALAGFVISMPSKKKVVPDDNHAN